jgi:hypothetical protein
MAPLFFSCHTVDRNGELGKPRLLMLCLPNFTDDSNDCENSLTHNHFQKKKLKHPKCKCLFVNYLLKRISSTGIQE